MSFDNNQNFDPQPQAVPPADPGFVPQQPVGGPAYYNQAPEPPKSNNTKTILIVVAVVVLLLCCCCVVAGGALWSNEDFQRGLQEGLEQSQSLLFYFGV